MEINNLNLRELHNEEHFQLQKEVKELIEQNGAEKLNILEVFNTYLPFFAQEEEALNLIRKNSATKLLEDADGERDILADGLSDAVSLGLKHYNEDVRAAAARYKIVLDQYGRIAKKPYDDETAAIYTLVKESTTTYAADIEKIGMTEWIMMLDTKNKAFESIRKSGISEKAKKTEHRMKTVRVDVDAAYKEIIKRINALMLINGPGIHETLVRELNTRIDSIKNQLGQRKGRLNKKNDKNNKASGTDANINSETKEK